MVVARRKRMGCVTLCYGWLVGGSGGDCCCVRTSSGVGCGGGRVRLSVGGMTE